MDGGAGGQVQGAQEGMQMGSSRFNLQSFHSGLCCLTFVADLLHRCHAQDGNGQDPETHCRRDDAEAGGQGQVVNNPWAK